MPSTISTRLGLALAFLCGATSAWAAGGGQCYARDYTAGHLARNPAQVVGSIRMFVPEDPRAEGVRLSATLADQGHVRGTGMGGRTLSQGLFCLSEAGPLRCVVDCDGGVIALDFREDGALHVETDHLEIGDRETCGGAVSLVEKPGLRVVYRLLQADAARCEGL